MRIAITTDHAGFKALRHLKLFLESLGHNCIDFGPADFNINDDYPDSIYPAAKAVADGQCERGFILGGSGQGEAIVANRLPGVRAALFYGPAVAKDKIDADGNKSNDPYEIIRLSRTHNDTNMLSLSSRFLSLDQMENAVRVWLETPFSGAERHKRRVKKIDG